MGGIYYCSLEFDGTMPIPAGGFFSVKFPFAGEKSDAWNMHHRTGPGQTENEFTTMPADGILWATVELVWQTGNYTLLRDAILHNNLRVATDRRPYTAGQQGVITKALQLRVSRGDTVALQVTHDLGQPQNLLQARLKMSLHTGIEVPPERRLRVREGTDPFAPVDPPGTTPAEGDGIEQPPIDPEGPEV